jgi:hypothetical protein
MMRKIVEFVHQLLAWLYMYLFCQIEESHSDSDDDQSDNSVLVGLHKSLQHSPNRVFAHLTMPSRRSTLRLE